MKLICNWIRNINETFIMNNNINVLSGKNWSGKSSIIQIIKDMLRGKTDIKDWSAILQYGWVGSDYDLTVNVQKGRIFDSPQIDIDLATPWFLMWKWKLVSWVNKSMDDRRQTISRFLKIDRDWFFAEQKCNPDIKWLTSELKTLKTEESVLTWELMEREWIDITNIEKPKEVKLVPGTLWNQSELDSLQARLDSIKMGEVPVIVPKPKEVKLDVWNIQAFNKLKEWLTDIKNQWLNIPTTCDKCWQDISDAEQMKEALRKKYANLVREIKAYDLKESNQEKYEQYRSDLDLHTNSVTRAENVKSNNLDKENQKKALAEEIKSFKLVTTTKWNEEEYEKYQHDLSNYNANEQIKAIREKYITTLKDKIKAIPTVDIEVKIKKYKECELKFVESLKDKLKLWDLEFIFYKELKSPNVNWEMFTPTFEVTYKGKNYNECSWWEKWIVDIIVAYLFIKESNLDMILIDNAEVGVRELQEIIKEYLSDVKVICTRIDSWDLKLTNKF